MATGKTAYSHASRWLTSTYEEAIDFPILYNLFPLTVRELGEHFNLSSALQFGSLPKLLDFEQDEDRALFLEGYALTYLQEEIWNEHLIKILPPFRKFLSVAAQMNGEILNFSKIADEVGIDWKSAKAYFGILEDTLLGAFLEPYHTSIRKRQRESPKFYLFDLGVKRALDGSIRGSIRPGSAEYGRAFEHFFIVELMRECAYRRNNFSLFYLRTKDNAEIDLIVERPGMPTCLVEIKSSDQVTERNLVTLKAFKPKFPRSVAILVSNDPKERDIDGVHVVPWRLALIEILG
jgi:predicted AAA+ superfamily ATPase